MKLLKFARMHYFPFSGWFEAILQWVLGVSYVVPTIPSLRIMDQTFKVPKDALVLNVDALKPSSGLPNAHLGVSNLDFWFKRLIPWMHHFPHLGWFEAILWWVLGVSCVVPTIPSLGIMEPTY